ncbi:carboxypeptidase-like regulatory domain-containing protein [Niastella populi]|uniref:Carboxypeptidase regulatory-like domain-containing protein n=1 Tax=Niastella populi TaxID=550983 RepID=A0A1V9F229_9BACT|nr:carboxypeptidase-like regulatory domain-containing protein [Niastella populi]OQP52473.1 hypothetical protein A4R26_28640 [Niastella populi]
MKKVLTFGFSAVLLALLIIVSCQKSATNGPDTPNNEKEIVTASIAGRILDENQQPVSGAVVKAGSLTATTDINGNFSINNASLDKNAGFIKVEKDGFFQGSRTIVVNEGVVNYISLQLIKRTVSGTVNGSSGGNIAVQGGGSIVFTGNSFVNTAGNSAYTGTVSVSTFLLNPAASNFNEIMPGTLRGITTGNDQTGLQSFGMMAVELTGANGEKLQLAAGKTATLTFPIPPAMLSQAPNTIPLWSFNDSTGLWNEEGTATKQGSNYVGTVSHFSFWNCDVPVNFIHFKAIVKDQNGNPFSSARVTIQVTSDAVNANGSGYTDATGRVGGYVPKGKALQMKIYNKCNALVYTKDIGPFNADADLGTVTITNPATGSVTISGTVINCSAGAVTNGYVEVYLDSMFNRATVTNGNFSITISRCNNVLPVNASVIAYDLGNNQGGSSSSITVSSATVNAGQLSACGTSLTQFVNYTLNGVPKNYTYPADSVLAYKNGGNNTYTVWATRKNQANEDVYFTFTATGTGSTPLSSINITEGSKYYRASGAITVNITEWTAGSGGFMAGNLTGKVADSFSTAPLNLTFRAQKQ